LCNVLARGHTRRAAARKTGIPESTLATWLRDGHDTKDPMRRALVEAIDAAEGEGEFRLLEIVREAAEIDSQQAKWILERRYSVGDETWARKDHLAVSSGERPIEISVVRELVERRALALGANSTGTPASGNGEGSARGGDGGTTERVTPEAPPPHAGGPDTI
jgi:hypothetical protein